MEAQGYDEIDFSESDVALAKEWARSGSNTRAARAAGYKGKYPSGYAHKRLRTFKNGALYAYAMTLRRDMASEKGVSPSTLLDVYAEMLHRTPPSENPSVFEQHAVDKTRMMAAEKLESFLQFFDTKTEKRVTEISGAVEHRANIDGYSKEFIDHLKRELFELYWDEDEKHDGKE